MADATQVQFRRGTTAETAAFTGALGELTIDTTLKTAVVHDGATAGGMTLAKTVSPVLVTPALGTPSSGVLTNCTGTAAGLTAGAATVLATARAINGVNFDGSAAITVGQGGGTYAARPAASAVPSGYLYTVTSGALKGVQFRSDGSAWTQVGIARLWTQTVDTAISGTATETDVLTTTTAGDKGVGELVLPADCWAIGSSLRYHFEGANDQTPGAAFRHRAYLNAVGFGDTTAVATVVLTDLTWVADGTIVCRTTGATGTAQYHGAVFQSNAGGAVNGIMYKHGSALRPAAATYTPQTYDTTATQQFKFTQTMTNVNTPKFWCLSGYIDVGGLV